MRARRANFYLTAGRTAIPKLESFAVAQALKLTTGGLRAVYRTLELPDKHPLNDAHGALDAAGLATYGFDPEQDLPAQLLALNLAVAERQKTGKPVTPPGCVGDLRRSQETRDRRVHKTVTSHHSSTGSSHG